MNFWGKAAVAATVVWVSTTAFAMTDPSPRNGEPVAALATADASADARYVEQWIHARNDDHGRPFVIVDKKAARVFVFAPGGKLVGSSSTLLGLAHGDVAVPGAGQKDPSRLLPFERRTPAGRFESQPGRNLSGEAVVWVDYDTGIAIHRIRPGRSQAARLRKVAGTDAEDKRVSLGCVVVPENFFTTVVLPTMGHAKGVVYVLPEDEPVQAMFGAPQRNLAAARPAGASRTVADARAPSPAVDSRRTLADAVGAGVVGEVAVATDER
jgi:hypothetical protein